MRALILTLISASALLIVGCGGSGGGQVETSHRDGASTTPNGLWLSTYLLFIEDQCGLLSEGEEGFIDEQEVLVEDNAVTLFSSFLPTPVYEGEMRGDDSFLANATLEGDLFGDGTFCQLIEDVAFNNVTPTSAESIYHVQIVCSDGFQCDSAVRGVAERVESFDIPETIDEESRTRVHLVKG